MRQYTTGDSSRHRSNCPEHAQQGIFGINRYESGGLIRCHALQARSIDAHGREKSFQMPAQELSCSFGRAVFGRELLKLLQKNSGGIENGKILATQAKHTTDCRSKGIYIESTVGVEFFR